MYPTFLLIIMSCGYGHSSMVLWCLKEHQNSCDFNQPHVELMRLFTLSQKYYTCCMYRLKVFKRSSASGALYHNSSELKSKS